MKAYIVTTFIGVFGIDENNKILAFRQLPRDWAKAAEKLKKSEIELIEEEKQVRDELGRKKFRTFIYGYRKPGVKHVESNTPAENFVKENLRKLAVDYKVVKDQTEFNQLFAKVNIELAKVKIKSAVGRDSLISQVSGAMEELDKSINVFVERLREWYGLHFPEMERAVGSHEKFVKLVEKFGSRKNIEDPELNLIKEKSIGADFGEEDVKTMQLLAAEIDKMFTLREDLSKYLEKLLKDIAPNFTELCGAPLAARMISHAGGLDKISRMPSSTVQLLGSEKALFRFLHGQGRSPRFGILYNHPLVQNAPEKLKGRIARVLASKLSIAAKLDYYGKEYRADKMKKELHERVKEILSSK